MVQGDLLTLSSKDSSGGLPMGFSLLSFVLQFSICWYSGMYIKGIHIVHSDGEQGIILTISGSSLKCY